MSENINVVHASDDIVRDADQKTAETVIDKNTYYRVPLFYPNFDKLADDFSDIKDFFTGSNPNTSNKDDQKPHAFESDSNNSGDNHTGDNSSDNNNDHNSDSSNSGGDTGAGTGSGSGDDSTSGDSTGGNSAGSDTGDNSGENGAPKTEHTSDSNSGTDTGSGDGPDSSSGAGFTPPGDSSGDSSGAEQNAESNQSRSGAGAEEAGAFAGAAGAAGTAAGTGTDSAHETEREFESSQDQAREADPTEIQAEFARGLKDTMERASQFAQDSDGDVSRNPFEFGDQTETSYFSEHQDLPFSLPDEAYASEDDGLFENFFSQKIPREVDLTVPFQAVKGFFETVAPGLGASPGIFMFKDDRQPDLFAPQTKSAQDAYALGQLAGAGYMLSKAMPHLQQMLNSVRGIDPSSLQVILSSGGAGLTGAALVTTEAAGATLAALGISAETVAALGAASVAAAEIIVPVVLVGAAVYGIYCFGIIIQQKRVLYFI